MYRRSAISRPGDGDRSPVFDLNFNRAELKIAECLQLLDKATTHHLFSKPVSHRSNSNRRFKKIDHIN